jgi:hypothetical protein
MDDAVRLAAVITVLPFRTDLTPLLSPQFTQ